MDIVLIGSGNVATVLGRKALAAGHRIVQVYSPQQDHANKLAIRLGTSSTSYISSISRNADLFIIALRDEVLAPFLKDFRKINSLVVHTAGALSIHELSNSSATYGVLYPLQSLRKELENLPALTLLVDGNDAGTKNQISSFAGSISETVLPANDNERLKYHLAGTIVNNFTNHLFSIVASFCEKENISFTVLQPLMEETVMRLRNTKPAFVQTGPAVRHDLATIEKQRQLLPNYPELLKFYELFTEEIQKSALNFQQS
jgi:predicted short-subunit dehydrogenase-like oxidoreductase (DUF2520 family)